MDTKRLTTGGILGVVATVLMYVAAILMLFLPICSVTYQQVRIGTSTLVQTGNITLYGSNYLTQSGLHIFFFIAILLLSSITIPMFGDTQMNSRSCIIILRSIFLFATFAFLAAFLLDVVSPLRIPNAQVEIRSFSVLNGGVLAALLSLVSLILNIVSTVLCSVEKESVRRAIFFSAQCKNWRAEEVLIGVFTGICGGFLGCLPYVFIKNAWKRKYGDIRTEIDGEGNPVMPSATQKRRNSATLNYFSYAAKLLTSYKTLLDNGTISEEEYAQIKCQVLNGMPCNEERELPTR